jgi:hypothetical protein
MGSLETKSFRKKFRDVRLLGTAGTLEKYSRVWSEFIDHLAASPTWGTGHAMIVGYRDGPNLNLRA